MGHSESFSYNNRAFTIYMFEEVSQVFARHKAHSTKYKIDEFIDKLLASKKFDILAEKFAQKAIERMISLNPNLRLAKDFAAQINVPPKIAFQNVFNKTDVYLGDTTSPLKNLSLKFKHFTKGVFHNIHSSENKDTDINKLDVLNSKNFTDVEKKIKVDDDDESINISDLDNSLQDKPESSTEGLKQNIQRENEKLSHDQINQSIKQEEVNYVSISMENKKNADISENEMLDSHKKNEGHIDGVVSDFDKNVREDKPLFSNEPKEVINGKSLEKPSRKRIHKEGNRLYTFQSSSDYEEYHQELKRVEKERKVFV